MKLQRVLVLNAGSSSLKWSVLDAESEAVTLSEEGEWADAEPREREALIHRALDSAGEVKAIGHRVVHGGMLFRDAVRADQDTINRLESLNELAPLHNPLALECLEAALRARPHVVQVAAFDTAFHHTIPDKAALYAIPRRWTERWGIRRFGFHGLSVSYAARRAAEALNGMPQRHVVCHLGAGCSITAVRDGRSVDTTMGFTPLEGLMMATRSGSVDPGLLLYLAQHGLTITELNDGLEHHSGLLGVSGVSADIRDILAVAEKGNEAARIAVDMFIYRIIRAVGALAAVLGGIDVLTFTGGVGEHAAVVRERVIRGLAYLGVRVDDAVNRQGNGDRDIGSPASTARILVLKAREDLSILREVKRLTS
ncbi:MAG: acetate kinase [Chloroflexi bacterium]|nr:acetate kinase [Chloroflexota bacterium]